MSRPRWMGRMVDRISAFRPARDVQDRTPIRHAWATLDAGAGAEARAGALLRQAIVRQPMSDLQLAVVHARLRRLRGSPVRGRRLVQIAAGLAVMLLAGALFAAASHFLGWAVRESSPSGNLDSGRQRSIRRHAGARARRDVAEPPDKLPPMIQELPDPPKDQGPVTGPTAGATLQPPGASAAAPPAKSTRLRTPVIRRVAIGKRSPLAEESQLLARALRELREDDDPAAAMLTLEDHARRFGRRGALATEADTARVEALLRLGRHAEALAWLDGMTLASIGPSRKLLAARAELRVEQGRCAAASVDFDRLLERLAERDGIAERALHGRAGCRTRAGDAAGARFDLEIYLSHFPDGRFADDARAALSTKGFRGAAHEDQAGGTE